MKPSKYNRRISLQKMAALSAVAVAGLHGRSASAQTATNFIVPYPAGGPGDVAARQMLPFLRQALGRPVIVDNVAGASGAIAVQKLLAAPSDGSSFMLGTPNEIILAPLALAAVKYKPDQVRLVGLISRSPLVLVGGMQMPKTFDEALTAAGKPGGKVLSYGTSGVGSLFHLVSEDFKARLKAPMLHVPYKGTAPMVQDLIGGQIDMAFVPTGGNVLDLIAGGKLQVYAVTSKNRYPRIPDVPTMAEAFALTGFEYELWGGVFVTRSTPNDVIEKLSTAITRTMQDVEYRKQVEAGGGTMNAPVTLAQADVFMAEEVAKYRRIAGTIKLDPQ